MKLDAAGYNFDMEPPILVIWSAGTGQIFGAPLALAHLIAAISIKVQRIFHSDLPKYDQKLKEACQALEAQEKALKEQKISWSNQADLNPEVQKRHQLYYQFVQVEHERNKYANVAFNYFKQSSFFIVAMIP